MPTDELENELRSTFIRAAADFENPEQARRRVLQHDYHPRRASRLLPAGITAAAVGAVLVLGLSGVFGSASPAPAHSTRPARLAAFSIVSSANGTSTLTLNRDQFNDPGGLRQALAQHGIPALVTVSSFCSSEPAPPSSGVISIQRPDPQVSYVIVINPSAMPTGTELSLGLFRAGPRVKIAMTLVNHHAYTCSSSSRVSQPQPPAAHSS
jgi:hypothetical protein